MTSSSVTPGWRVAAITLVIVCAFDASARAQDPDQPPPPSTGSGQNDDQHHTTTAAAWTWTTDANVFAGYNYQQRKFADFAAWESQNWFMGAGERSIGSGRLTVLAMLSLEPFTVGRLVYVGDAARTRIDAGGSPQLYQTGESYRQTPLVNYQHPHDLIMGLGATYRLERPRVTYRFGAHLVGSPALGPTAFMHRDSARSNPQAPLNHHSLDSTHITPGVLTAGVELGQVTFEASAFRGAEPDENRYNLEKPKLDSYSARVGWRLGAWQAQVSGGHLHVPEWFEPYDVTRLTASIGFDGEIASRPFDLTVAWGKNIEYNGFNNRADGYLAEWDLRATPMTTVYGRAEAARKELFGLGSHPKGFNHPHIYSDIDALTIGLVRDVFADDRWGRFGVGADATVYRTSIDLELFYGSSRSYHLFLRWRPNRTPTGHVH